MSSAKQPYLKMPFLVCAVILLIAASTKALIIRIYGIQMVKQEIKLQKPFDEMDESALLPFIVRDKGKIENREILESLGTEQYIQWLLEDPDAPPDSPTRYCSIFLTYYSGTPDMVPHVPDECYAGGGNRTLGKEGLTLDVPMVGCMLDRRTEQETTSVTVSGERNQKVNFQYIRFAQTDASQMQTEVEFSVQYFFHVNGQYSKDRTQTRFILGSNWFSKYSYFCKVEWKFYGRDAFGIVYPDKTQTLAASEKLLSVLLPELEKNHWPDWEAANAE